MNAIDVPLAAGLLAGLILLQLPLRLLARGLGGRLPALLSALAVALPLVLLTPWLDRERTLAPTGFLRQVLPGARLGGVTDIYGEQLNDVVTQLLPWELEVRKAFAARRLPLWSDSLDGGSSPWANPQAGVLSPVALAARLFPFRHFLLAALAFKLAIALSGAGFLARRLGMRAPAAALVAVIFALSGGMLAWALFPLSTTVAFTPWLAAGTLRLMRRPTAGSVVATAISAAAVLLSGHPEVALAAALFAGFLALLLRHRAGPFLKSLAATGLAAMLAVALAAPLLLPFLAALPDSQRMRDRSAAGPAGQAPRQVNFYLFSQALDGEAFHRPYSQNLTLWPISAASYCGTAAVLGVALALVGATRRSRRQLGLVLALLLFWCAILVLAALPLALPPLLHFIAVPEYSRFVPVAGLALCLAAGLGLDALLRGAAGTGAAIAGLIVGTAAGLTVRHSEHALLCWALLVPAALLALRPSPRWRRAAGWAVLVVATFDGMRWGRTLLPPGEASLAYPPTTIIADLQRETQAGGPWRVTAMDSLAPASVLSVFGLSELRPHSPLAPAAQLRVLGASIGYTPSESEYFSPVRNIDHPLLDFLNVRAVVSNRYLPAPLTLTRCGGEVSPPFELWCNPNALPRWFVPSGTDAVPNTALDAWIHAMRDPWRVAVEPRDEGRFLPAGTGPPRVRVLAAAPGRVSLEVDGDGERLLASSVPGPRGWRARSFEGSSLRTLGINGAFLGVALPAGVRRVELRYVPPGLPAGLAAFGTALLGLAGLAIAARRPSARAALGS